MAYTPSEDVKKKEKDYYSHLYGNKPGEFSSENTEKANKVLSDYENRGEFKYNPATDVGYQAARKQYTQGGQQAMKDTLGTATELTGGYDNSYAQAAAQQTYNQYMSELSSLMPQYEQQAYERYVNEGQQMKDYYGILKNAEAQDYSMYRDKVGDYYTEADMLYGNYSDAYANDYNNYWAGVNQANIDRDYERAVYESDRSFEHTVAMDEASAAAAQTNADADYLTALAEYNDSLAEDDPIFYEYAGAVMGEDDEGYDVRTGTRFYKDGKEYTYDLGINPYTSSKNADVAAGAKTMPNGYQPSQIAQRDDKGNVVKWLDLTEATEYKPLSLYGKEQKVWKTEDGELWYWNGSENTYVNITALKNTLK